VTANVEMQLMFHSKAFCINKVFREMARIVILLSITVKQNLTNYFVSIRPIGKFQDWDAASRGIRDWR